MTNTDTNQSLTTAHGCVALFSYIKESRTQAQNVTGVTHSEQNVKIFEKALARCKKFDIMGSCKQAQGCKQAKGAGRRKFFKNPFCSVSKV